MGGWGFGGGRGGGWWSGLGRGAFCEYWEILRVKAGCQTWHVLLWEAGLQINIVSEEMVNHVTKDNLTKIFIHLACVESVKEIVPRLLILDKYLQILVDSLVNSHPVLISDGIFSQEIKLHNKLLVLPLLV